VFTRNDRGVLLFEDIHSDVWLRGKHKSFVNPFNTFEPGKVKVYHFHSPQGVCFFTTLQCSFTQHPDQLTVLAVSGCPSSTILAVMVAWSLTLIGTRMLAVEPDTAVGERARLLSSERFKGLIVNLGLLWLFCVITE
jgi:hypothetical protein